MRSTAPPASSVSVVPSSRYKANFNEEEPLLRQRMTWSAVIGRTPPPDGRPGGDPRRRTLRAAPARPDQEERFLRPGQVTARNQTRTLFSFFASVCCRGLSLGSYAL